MAIFTHTESDDLAVALLQASEKEVIQEWVSVPEKDQYSVLVNLNGAKNFAQKSLYLAIKKIVDPSFELLPVNAFIVGWDIKNAKSVAEVKQILTKKKIPVQDEIVFSELKEIIKNSIDVLIKVYLILSNSDAYNYIQIAKIMNVIDKNKAAHFVKDVQLAHSNFASLISWFNLAQAYDEGRELTGLKDDENPVQYPKVELVENAVLTTIALFKEMKIFGNAIIKNLSETRNVLHFFVTVDAILMAMTTKITPDFMILRKKLAFYFVVQDFISDTGTYVVNRIQQTKS